ncbi:hypothetical protein PQO03_12400 [Lentisphaera profundi]|uniref:Uncharacterized protein n=1 Tax=Lentisphaera profundi TaxID=1658616 RepID=A0ABY7W0I8_9BACT|nr:hypothetical protein [Lentisphaera profundi]WDE98637.1 hypothetical protein PQO03_12400 [Lentisphaera profundi]
MDNEPPLETDRFIKAYARENRPKNLWQKFWPWSFALLLGCGVFYAL